ncbi:uncharacterized protein L3040_000753 [Drepanopeziza brunnea f. sp. 'multigermtubi']|uniref:uncharacterized protein n=1 Tax=Drepanopeziza brunnea f. sp. 'multigermtubi' TaxID=698441 RepID=UPI00238B15DB|nr:hypothetical protein L3040_000753 [Drepanopeziza brunnea f. sp. 'multigermtubi']
MKHTEEYNRFSLLALRPGDAITTLGFQDAPGRAKCASLVLLYPYGRSIITDIKEGRRISLALRGVFTTI